MKLTKLDLTGFRAFGRQQEFDLDADAVIVLGNNGQGKTSLFDGILWAITGRIPRFGTDEEIVSKYSESGVARVSLQMRDSEQNIHTITRSFDGLYDVRTR